MTSRNGFLRLALSLIVAFSAIGTGLAKPPDLPIDPRVVCPEGSDGDEAVQISPEATPDDEAPFWPDGFDVLYR